MLTRLLRAPVEIRDPSGLTEAAWRLADELGWAKTYDAHYVAFAQDLGCKLVTLDERLIRGVARLGVAVRPGDLYECAEAPRSRPARGDSRHIASQTTGAVGVAPTHGRRRRS